MRNPNAVLFVLIAAAGFAPLAAHADPIAAEALAQQSAGPRAAPATRSAPLTSQAASTLQDAQLVQADELSALSGSPLENGVTVIIPKLDVSPVFSDGARIGVSGVTQNQGSATSLNATVSVNVGGLTALPPPGR